MMEKTCFDDFAESYDHSLEEALAISGEGKEFFARGRISWLARCLPRKPMRRVLDFGCAIGSDAPLLTELVGAEETVGVDTSPRCIERALSLYGSAATTFLLVKDYRPAGDFDLTYCNGVFHHIPPAERLASLRLIFDSLKSGGLFCLWENNPWNVGTRYIMSRCAFDADAITLSVRETASLLRSAGFQVLRRDFQFFFPRFLKSLRPLECRLNRVPLGAQYQVLARRP